MSSNCATIISGILSMFGGIIGAVGAYCAAKHQMNKIKTNDNENRLVDLKITKLDETIKTFNNLKHLINSLDGIIKDINIDAKKRKKEELTFLILEDKKEDVISKISDSRKEIEQNIKNLNINNWYIKNLLNFDDLYDKRNNYFSALKKYSETFSDKKIEMKDNTQTIGLLESLEKSYDENYLMFLKFINGTVSNLEKEIEKIYKP